MIHIDRFSIGGWQLHVHTKYLGAIWFKLHKLGRGGCAICMF